MTMPPDVQIGIKDAWWIVTCLFGAGMLKSFGEEMGKAVKRKLWDRKSDYVDKHGNRKYRDEQELLTKLVSLRETEFKERMEDRIRHEAHEGITKENNSILKDCEASFKTIPTLNENVIQVQKILNGEPG